jgi:hypothetical protein
VLALMPIARAIDTPVHLQWDPSSRLPLPDPGSAPNNCGPTTIVNIAHYYRDESFGIYLTRRLGTTDDWRGTSVNEQAEMLRRRGVPCFISQMPLWAVHKYVGSGNRPILAGLDMAKVPLSVAGHPFRGKHAVEILQTAWRNNGESRGVLVRDPNFNRTYRTAPTGGQRWYPDWVIDVAFCKAGMWGVVPEKAKDVRRFVNVDGPDVNIRHAPPAPFTPGNVFARSRRDGIYRLDNDKRLSGLGYDFKFLRWREIERGEFAIVEGYGRRLAIRKNNIHFV